MTANTAEKSNKVQKHKREMYIYMGKRHLKNGNEVEKGNVRFETGKRMKNVSVHSLHVL